MTTQKPNIGTMSLLGFAAIGIVGSAIDGYIKGSHMKQGIPHEPQSLDTILKYAPAAYGALGGIGFTYSVDGGRRLVRNTKDFFGILALYSFPMVAAQGIGIGAAYLFGN